jgi:hypothetical protein
MASRTLAADAMSAGKLRHRRHRAGQNPSISALFRNWHGPCKVPDNRSDASLRGQKGKITMFNLQSAQRFVTTSVAALVFAAIAVSAAVPVLPIA